MDIQASFKDSAFYQWFNEQTIKYRFISIVFIYCFVGVSTCRGVQHRKAGECSADGESGFVTQEVLVQ